MSLRVPGERVGETASISVDATTTTFSANTLPMVSEAGGQESGSGDDDDVLLAPEPESE